MLFCNKTDELPERCDHLVSNREMLAPNNAIVLVVVEAIVWMLAVQDVDEALEQALILRALSTQTRLPWGTLIPLWMSVQIKRFFMPACVFAAFVNLVIAYPMTAINL